MLYYTRTLMDLNAYIQINTNTHTAHTHLCTYLCTHSHAHTHTHMCTHTRQ